MSTTTTPVVHQFELEERDPTKEEFLAMTRDERKAYADRQEARKKKAEEEQQDREYQEFLKNHSVQQIRARRVTYADGTTVLGGPTGGTHVNTRRGSGGMSTPSMASIPSRRASTSYIVG